VREGKFEAEWREERIKGASWLLAYEWWWSVRGEHR
jgi:hypothetical protein